MKSVKNILLLDTDFQSAGQIINTLSIGKDAFTVQHAGGITEGLNYLQSSSPDLVLLDGNMAESGEFAAVQTKLEENNIPCILLSEAGGKNMVGLAEKTGAREYVVKSGITPSHLLKTIVNTLRLSETENRLNLIIEEYSGRISSFSQMLDAFSAGAVVINKDGAMQYANARASALMNDEALNNKIMPSLNYYPITGVEIKEIAEENIIIRASNIEWGNETCNLFIIENSTGQPSLKADINLVTGLLNVMPGHWILLKGGLIEFANKGAELMLLSTGSELKGKRIETLVSTPAFREVLDTEGKNVKCALTLADGTSVAINYSASNLNIGNEIYQLLALITLPTAEIAGEGIAEENIPHEALGNFGGPTTSVVRDIQLMINCISSGNLTQAAELAHLAETGVGKMGDLLGVFKDYLALNTLAPETNEFSMKALVEEALQNLKPKIDAVGAEINISELPTVKADEKRVLHVLEQLLNNALQFSRKDKKPVIDIGHDKYEGNYIFCIRDNGIGISRKDHVKIFEPFEKLNALNKGNGLGLAVCKSIVEKHGGKIWVESLPGHGSNFYFTLAG